MYNHDLDTNIEKKIYNKRVVFILIYKHENYLVIQVVMYFEFLPVRQHINDKIYDNFVHLLIEHIYETSQVNNEKYNHRQQNANKRNFN